MNIKKNVARLGMLTAMGLIAAYAEFLLNINIGVPGVKIGLANIATVMALYMLGAKGAFAVCVARVGLSGLLFGSLSSLIYAMAGAIAALITMILLKRVKIFTAVGVSAAGGVMHNAAQLLMAYIITHTPGLMYYAPVLAICGAAAGTGMGFLSIAILKRIKRV